MLESTFVHVPGIGPHRERQLWERGYTEWRAFLRGFPDGAWREHVASRLDRTIAARDLPAREAWRLACEFPRRTAFLDIETEGLGIGTDAVTCIGLSDGSRVEAFVRGENLDRFPHALERFDLLVTYNGRCFDIPMLQTAFPAIDFRRFHHLDLRFPLHRLGYKGGLKGVERALGLTRSGDIEGVDGYVAVLLWRTHVAGHPSALETLIRYCLEDVVHLMPLAAHAYNRLAAALPIQVEPMRAGSLPRIPYRADGGLVRDLLRRIGRATDG